MLEGIPKFQAEHGEAWLDAFTAYYLGKAHRCDSERVCAMTSLSSDVGRGGLELKTIYERYMVEIAKLMAVGMPGDDEEDRERRAWTVLSQLIGALTLARAMNSEVLSEHIVDATKSVMKRA